MKNKDTKLLEEAMDGIYGTRGVNTIKVVLMDGNGKVLDSMDHEVSGDEAAWHAYQSVHKILSGEE